MFPYSTLLMTKKCNAVFRGLVCIHSEHCFHFFRRSKQSQPCAAQAQVVQHAAADQKQVVISASFSGLQPHDCS